MKLYLEVTGDVNDGDYVTQRTRISRKKLELFKPLFQAIRNFKPYKSTLEGGQLWEHHHNFPFDFREDLGEKSTKAIYVDSGLVKDKTFEDFEANFIPYIEGGIHTITSIKLLEVAKEKKLV